jgi:hypothetical protein
MKSQPIVVILSVLAAGLITAIAYTQFLGPAPTPTEPPAVAQVQTSPDTNAVATTTATGPTLSWRQIESEDYHKYIANLRAFGCPEQTIRDIVLADINKLYADRENPLKTKPKATPENPAGETPEQKLERLRQLRTVQQEKRWAIKELLGIDLPLDLLPSSGARDYHSFEVAFKYLPAEKRDAVQMLQENYWQQSDTLKAKYDKARTPEYAKEERQLKDSLRQELAKVLTPQELEDYDLRTSTIAKQMSSNLSTYFRPTEDEFRQLYRARRDYEAALEQLSASATTAIQPGAPVDPKALAQQRAAEKQAVQQARTTAQNQMNEQLKSSLGADRYADYQRSQDRAYDLLARLGTRYSLPQETVLEAYNLQKSFKAPQGGTDQAAARAEAQKQLNDQLTTILGEQAARGYRRVQGGTVPIN